MNSAKPSKAGNHISPLLISKINYDASLFDLPRIILSLAVSPEKLRAKTENLSWTLRWSGRLKLIHIEWFHNPFEEYVHVKLGINHQIFTLKSFENFVQKFEWKNDEIPWKPIQPSFL